LLTDCPQINQPTSSQTRSDWARSSERAQQHLQLERNQQLFGQQQISLSTSFCARDFDLSSLRSFAIRHTKKKRTISKNPFV